MLDNSDLVIAGRMYDINGVLSVEVEPHSEPQDHPFGRASAHHSLYQPQVQVVGDISDSLGRLLSLSSENEPELFSG